MKICRSIHAPPGEAVDVEGGGAGEEEKEKGLNLNSIVERAEVMFLMQKNAVWDRCRTEVYKWDRWIG